MTYLLPLVPNCPIYRYLKWRWLAVRAAVSSVLESLVGRDFLPRGCDICTRRPLVLMLENRPPSSDEDRVEWGEFRHLPGRRFYDFSQIRREIEAETEREAGCNKGVSEKQIRLKISPPNVLNMTLIDLPGITTVPVGYQPSDIETRIRIMIVEHINNENCIILAVSPANSDLTTSGALQIAKLADPSGSRTVGVITKLDIMDRRTNACNFLLGSVAPLKLGYVGVVNRCQEILEQHIRKDLPRLKAVLNSRMHASMKEMQTYGDVESKAEQGATLLHIIRRYCDGIQIAERKRDRYFTVAPSSETDIVEFSGSEEMPTKELFGGARIHYLFQSMFEMDPCEKLTDEDIAYALRNSSGLRNVLFVPEAPFEVLVRRQIAQLSDPCHQCLWIVYDELIKISQACESTGLQRSPSLRRNVTEAVRKFLDAAAKPAETMIRNLFEMEVPTSEKGQISRTAAAQSVVNGVSIQVNRPQSNNELPVLAGGSSSTSKWGISSIFGSKASSRGPAATESAEGTLHLAEHMTSMIQLREHRTTNLIADISLGLPKFPDLTNGKRSSSHMPSSSKSRARKLLYSEEPSLSFGSNAGFTEFHTLQ
ncbi:Dynamin-related protein 3A isoform 2 [Hibiscus syriacus]|uniref:Dynamin-related protein 3A isoform 2 n=1 Tax=Hibiscus syriacus TaxID=106335 RepID=A0A6A3D986_HIBSY|nr:Dynamin-related protein 3A isoform 2 [Hibiscus syriacus]